MTVVYAFMYTPCIYESAASPISLHTTKKGAFKAMNQYLNDRWYGEYWKHITRGKGRNKKWKRKYPETTARCFKVGEGEAWYVKCFEVNSI